MYSALLLSLALGGAPAHPAAAAVTKDPPIQIWINNDRRFFPGDRAKVEVRTADDGYLVVLHADPEGTLRVLFPLDPNDDNFVRGGRKYQVRGRGDRESFDVDNRSGRGTVYAAVSAAPFRFGEFVLGDHWDYRTLAPGQLPRDPETELTDLVRRMAQGSFDYDILSYDVIERVYASSAYYDQPYYGSVYYGDSWCCSGISIGLAFGHPFRRHYYGPFGYYDPFYDPFFYDPWYYRPHYYRPAYWYPFRPYHYGYYSYGFYPRHRGHFDTPRFHDWNRSHRFRGFGGNDVDYRDRRFTFRRAVNTVYTPPIGRFAQAERSSPLRRTVERVDRSDPRSAAPAESRRTAEPRRATSGRPASERRQSGGEARRATATGSERSTPSVDRRRIETPGRIEARRAREPETVRTAAPEPRDRRDWPVDVTPRGRSNDRPEARRAVSRDESPRYEARSSRGAEARPAPARRAERRSEPRAAPRSASPKVERPAPSRSSGDYGGGRRSSGDRGGGHGGGGRRR